MKNDATIYVHEPLQPRQDQINILQHYLCQHPTNPISSNFDDIIISWYRNLLLSGDHSTNTTGVENHLFAAFGLHSPKHTHDA